MRKEERLVKADGDDQERKSFGETDGIHWNVQQIGGEEGNEEGEDGGDEGAEG